MVPGTRHRAAFDHCTTRKGGIAMIVSQIGELLLQLLAALFEFLLGGVFGSLISL